MERRRNRVFASKPPREPKDPRLKNRLFEFRMAKSQLERQAVYAAKVLHCTRKQIWFWENGTFLPKPDKISLICSYYGAPFDVLWPHLRDGLEGSINGGTDERCD